MKRRLRQSSIQLRSRMSLGIAPAIQSSELECPLDCHSSRAHLTERSSERQGGCSGERLRLSSLGEGRPYCSALGRFKYGLTGKAIIQIAIASPASSDIASIILST
jgi:hypothetical protein